MKIHHAKKLEEGKSAYWTTDCPLEQGSNCVVCIVDVEPADTVVERVISKIVAHVRTYRRDYAYPAPE